MVKKLCDNMPNLVFPADELAGLSYYEILCKIHKKLGEVIEQVNANETNIQNFTDDMTNKYNKLVAVWKQTQEWITHYFDNLDVQEEVNNKLDDMLASGQFEDIIFNFFQINLVFPTVNDMTDDTTIQNGQYLTTLGYYQLNDGGGAQYVSRNTPPQNKPYVVLNNNLYAELIIDNEITPLQVGAYGDGVHDDTAALKTCINAAKNYNVVLKSSHGAKYRVSETIVVNSINIDFNNSTLLTNDNLEHLLTINSTNPGNYTHITNTYRNIILDGSNITGAVLYIAANKTLIEGCTINNIGSSGLQLFHGFENTVRKCNINGDSTSICTGILINGNDHLLEDIVIIDCHTGVSVRGNNRYVRVHTWFYTKDLVADSKCFLLNSGFSYFLQCYSDTCQYGFYWKSYAVALIVNHSFFCANSEYLSGIQCYALYAEDELYVQNNLSILNTFSQGYNKGSINFSNFELLSDKSNIGRDAVIKYSKNINISLTSQYFNLIRGKLITLNNGIKIFDAVVTVNTDSVLTHNPVTIFKLPPPTNNIITSAMWDTEDFGSYKGSVGYTLLINSGNLAVRLNETTDNHGLIYISFHLVYF